MSADQSHNAQQWMTNWIEQVVVGEGLCPFARHSLSTLRVFATKSTTPAAVLMDVQRELNVLLNEPATKVSTSILVVPAGLDDFTVYLDMLELIELALEDTGLRGEIQVASFHPDYCFEGATDDDPANWTNRSPVPAFHFLREEHVSEARSRHDGVESIPQRNINHFRSLGLGHVKAMLRACYGVDDVSD
ncbi:MAG: DUF1415 domain-containing protein [Myxococcota bacterium]|nr:DUF1415 domain-containing protein [Myxococcota bacterium]